MKAQSKKETIMDHHQPTRSPLELPEAFLAPRRMPCVIFRFGRGRTGGTTALDATIQLARAAGRVVLIGDGDRRNPTLSALYPLGAEGGVLPPPTSDETADVKDWITSTVGIALRTQPSSEMSAIV